MACKCTNDELKKLRVLHAAVKSLMGRLDLVGELSADHPSAVRVVNALREIDGRPARRKKKIEVDEENYIPGTSHPKPGITAHRMGR